MQGLGCRGGIAEGEIGRASGKIAEGLDPPGCNRRVPGSGKIRGRLNPGPGAGLNRRRELRGSRVTSLPRHRSDPSSRGISLPRLGLSSKGKEDRERDTRSNGSRARRASMTPGGFPEGEKANRSSWRRTLESVVPGAGRRR